MGKYKQKISMRINPSKVIRVLPYGGNYAASIAFGLGAPEICELEGPDKKKEIPPDAEKRLAAARGVLNFREVNFEGRRRRTLRTSGLLRGSTFP